MTHQILGESESDFALEDYKESLSVVYNDGDKTCFFGTYSAHVAAVISALGNVDQLPLNTFMKQRSGIVQQVLRVAYSLSTSVSASTSEYATLRT